VTFGGDPEGYIKKMSFSAALSSLKISLGCNLYFGSSLNS